MPLFTLTSTDLRLEPVEFRAQDAGQVLGRIDGLGWNAADVHSDGEYLYSLRINPKGVWSITHKEEAKLPGRPAEARIKISRAATMTKLHGIITGYRQHTDREALEKKQGGPMTLGATSLTPRSSQEA